MKQHRVIIVGSGLASLMAACCLADNGKQDVAIVTKGYGGTPYIAAFNAVLPDSPYGDTVEQYCADMRAAGYGLNDKPLIEALGRCSEECIALLERWGVHFSAGENYRYLLRRTSGSTYPRSLCRNDALIGAHIVDVLVPRLKEAGVVFYEDTECAALLRDEAGVAGVTAIKGGKVFNLYSRCVVAGWGGVGNLYRETTYPGDVDGRTLAMAYEAGANLLDLEFVEFEPMVVLKPAGAKGEPCPTAMLGEGAYLRNTLGERFLLQVRPEGESGAPKSLINNAIAREVAAGRGTPEGGVYADLRHIDEARIRSYPWFWDRMTANGVNPKKELLTVGPVAHSHSGGMEINFECETNVPGLYAVGEAAGGMHGACRMAGNACTQAAVSGYAAGMAIAKKDIPAYAGEELPAQYAVDGETRARFADEIRGIVWDHVNRMRTAEGLAAAERRLGEILPQAEPDAYTHQLALSARLLVLAATERQETRGTHNRADHPEQSEGFRCSIRIRRGENGPETDRKER